MIAWHRLFGLLLDELFRGSAWQVVVEMDLSRKIQRLDIVVVRRTDGPPPRELPDGFAPLADHNLIGTDRIRVLVLSEVPATERNAIWNLFSGEVTRIQAAAQQFRRRKSEFSTILNQLFENYQQEGIPMPYTVEDFMREVTLEHLDLLPADERLRGLSSDERLRGLSSDERLRGLSSDERLRGLSSDERLKGLSPEEIESYLRRRRSDAPGNGGGNQAAP